MSDIVPIRLSEEALKGAVPWTEERLPVQLGPEELEAVQAKMKALDSLLVTKQHAKYKLELFFSRARSNTIPTPGILSFWESGSKFHGGGDAKLYICPGKDSGRNGCEAFIPDSANASSFLWCPKCGLRWPGAAVIGERIARLSMQKWSEVLLYYFVRLEHNADVYVKHSLDDIRTVAMVEQARQRGGEHLAKVRGKRARSIYPLRHIIADTANGADLYGRFRAFLTA